MNEEEKQIELNKNRMKRFVDLLLPDDKLFLKQFSINPKYEKHIFNIAGYNILRTTKGFISVKLMMGYDKYKKPQFSSSIRWNESLDDLDRMLVDIIEKAKISVIDNKENIFNVAGASRDIFED